jgi:hypothetical protein
MEGDEQKAQESGVSRQAEQIERLEKAVRALIQGNPEGARAEMGS